MHLETSSLSYRDKNLNRVRLGDLLAVIRLFFEDCTYRTSIPPGAKELLRKGGNASILARLERRHFLEDELLIDHLHADCARRALAETKGAHHRGRWQLHHPPTDGSYRPAALVWSRTR